MLFFWGSQEKKQLHVIRKLATLPLKASFKETKNPQKNWFKFS